MAYLAPTQSGPDHVLVVVTYRTSQENKSVYVVSSANNWQPEPMSLQDDATDLETDEATFATTFMVPKSVDCVTYKFRVGDGEWVWDHTAPTENDGFGGMNNRFDIPISLPPSTPPPDLEEVESPSTPIETPKDKDQPIQPEQSLFSDAPDARTTFPESPAATPRDLKVYDSGTEIDAPSISDWEPSSDNDGSAAAGYDGFSEAEVISNYSPIHSASNGTYTLYYAFVAVVVAVFAILLWGP